LNSSRHHFSNFMKAPAHSKRSGILAGGNWIIDQVKIIDVFPKRESLANILSQSQGTGGAPYNVAINLAKLGAPFPLAGAGLVVNATSQGMVGQKPLDLSLAALPKSALVADIVYAPLETPLLAQARRQGARVVDGLGMLLHQARPGFEAWFGVAPSVTPALRQAVLADP